MKNNAYYSWKEEFSILSSVIEVIQPAEFTWSPYCDTHVTQSYFIFCADSQDLGYNIDIKLCLGEWLRVVQNVNFWPSTFWPAVVTPLTTKIYKSYAASFRSKRLALFVSIVLPFPPAF